MPIVDGDSKNFRKTDIATDNSQRTGLLHITGSADETASAVLLFPRLLVSVVCGEDDEDPSNDQACQCFYSTGRGQSDTTTVGCVVTREKHKAQRCKKLVDAAGKCHEKQTVAEIGYFACEAKTAGAMYDKTGLPCTRPEHCGAYGKCTASAVCVPKDSAVWRPGWTPPDDAKRCTTDDHATTGCPNTHQCGLSLFDFTGRNEIVFDLPDTGDGAHAGLCRDTQDQDCDSDDDCPDGDACIGYRLSAGKHK